jgi:hypothetical protein
MAFKTVNDGFYYDSDVRALPKIASDLLLYLMTNPHGHFSGMYYLPLEIVPVESKLTSEEIDKAIAILANIQENQPDTYRVSDNENQQKQESNRVSVFGSNKKQHYFIRFDSRNNIIFIKSMLRHQTGGRMSERQIRSVFTHIVQFNKSSTIIPFLDYHRNYIRHCFLEFEKHGLIDEKKFAASKPRRENLQKDIEAFYQQHGLSFFCSKKYPIQQIQQEEEEAKEEASASNQILWDDSNSNEKEEQIPSKEDKQQISDLCLQLKDLNHGFDPYQFVGKTIKSHIPFQVTIDVLEQLIKYKATVRKAWPYALNILQKKYQQYNYAQALIEHMNFKEPIRLSNIKVID